MYWLYYNIQNKVYEELKEQENQINQINQLNHLDQTTNESNYEEVPLTSPLSSSLPEDSGEKLEKFRKYLLNDVKELSQNELLDNIINLINQYNYDDIKVRETGELNETVDCSNNGNNNVMSISYTEMNSQSYDENSLSKEPKTVYYRGLPVKSTSQLLIEEDYDSYQEDN